MPDTHPALQTVRVELGPRSYDILIGRGLIDRAGSEFAARLPGVRLAIVTDETVADLHLRRLKESLDAAGVEHVVFAIQPDANPAPIELRCTLRDGTRPLTETWSYLWNP